ncbi:MAG TPA: hypothetical protein DEB06_06990 [Phycisphaerales bacterium]|nr:hypothetical protein [Phycisphaerales bacterium]
MRILMLGWEFPPFISGGLGTACHGLTRALDRLGHRVQFVLPKSIDRSQSSHVSLLAPDPEVAPKLSQPVSLASPPHPAGQPGGGAGAEGDAPMHYRLPGFARTEFFGVPSVLRSVYPGMQTFAPGAPRTRESIAAEIAALRAAGVEIPQELLDALGPMDPGEVQALVKGGHYGEDVVGDAQRYARLVVRLCRDVAFDVVHAHDWMTYPAGMAIAQITGKPLVVHVHSTEFDRSGEHVHQRVYDIERRGMHASMKVVAVSNYTKGLCIERYGIDPDKVAVVYNGIDSGHQPEEDDRIESRDRIVLFLGRITMQKGPEYFVAAAKRVLEKVENVKFIVAGSGDMARRMIELAAEMGIGHKVLFTGFLRGKDVARVFRMADCYVMPSVSEPFGIAPLEAISHDVPVIISKQSGVSEVLTHALKVDFWDIDEMANKIIAVLRHPPLGQTLREHGRFEVRRLTWEGAAEKCVGVYNEVVRAMTERYLPAGVF